MNNNEKRQIEMTLRIAELIKAAKTLDNIEIAAYLVKKGVCDKQEIKRKERKAALQYDLIWND